MYVNSVFHAVHGKQFDNLIFLTNSSPQFNLLIRRLIISVYSKERWEDGVILSGWKTQASGLCWSTCSIVSEVKPWEPLTPELERVIGNTVLERGFPEGKVKGNLSVHNETRVNSSWKHGVLEPTEREDHTSLPNLSKETRLCKLTHRKPVGTSVRTSLLQNRRAKFLQPLWWPDLLIMKRRQQDLFMLPTKAGLWARVPGTSVETYWESEAQGGLLCPCKWTSGYVLRK